MRSLSTNELKEMKQKNGDITLINVLGADRFREEHIPGSKNVPLEDDRFTERVREVAGAKDRPIVVYCASQECSASPNAAKKLERSGFSKVYDYEGGMRAWKEAGESIEGQAAH